MYFDLYFVQCVCCSTVDVYTALAGATGALYGPLHGGANEVDLHSMFDIAVKFQ
jgi:citrate synthase